MRRGFIFFIKPRGGRLSRLKYQYGGKEKLLSLGSYPDVGLKRALEKRDDARKLVTDGIDPLVERNAENIAQADTFRAVAEEWLDLQSKTLAVDTVSILRGRLRSTLYPAFGSR